MTDHIDPEGELLSAWLAGELDRASTQDLERRLAADPGLAERLDRVHDTVVALRRLDAVDPPPGMSERLRARLQAERQPEVASLDAARRRRERTSRWPVLSAAAAVLALLAVVPVLSRSFWGRGDDTAMQAEYSVERTEGGDAAGADIMEAEEEAAGEALADQDPGLPGPIIAEGDRQGTAEAAPPPLGERLSEGTPETAALLGIPVDAARELAAQYIDVIRSAPPFTQVDATPADCLDAVIAGDQIAVPARVEGVDAGGTATLVYVLVTASPGSTTLDTVEVRTVDAVTCAEA